MDGGLVALAPADGNEKTTWEAERAEARKRANQEAEEEDEERDGSEEGLVGVGQGGRGSHSALSPPTPRLCTAVRAKP